MTEQCNPPGPAERDIVGKTVGRFTVDVRLGAGGMGEVYRARDTKLHRVVALKRVAPHLCADEKSRERFWQEALCASRLNDPHIAAIHDAFEDQHDIFLVMEYVEGRMLRERMRAPLPLREFLPIALQCAAGLDAAHRGGIQHRDIKPENILLTRDGQVKILDFGVARPIPGDGSGTTLDALSRDGFVGTYTYMAPEIIEQRPSDHRADIFSLGIVFYEALTGAHPFRAASFFQTCNRILKETPEPIGGRNSDVPARLEAVILRMLEKRPADRYATAADVLADLQEIHAADAEAKSSTRALPLPPRKSAWQKTVIAVLCVALAAAGWFAYRRFFQKPVLNEHASILITDFENHTGLPLFDQTVTEAVRESLEESHYFRVIPRSQMHEAAQRLGRGGATRIDRSLGRELCQVDNCRAVLTGTIVRTGAKHEITESLVDPAEDATVLVETASMNSPADLYSAVDTLTRKLRRDAGESLAQISRDSAPLEQVTTSSLLALQRYSQALDFYTAGNMEAFLPLMQSAVALDPNFAMAHLYLSRAYDALGATDKMASELAAAVRGADHVTERERYLIQAENYSAEESYENAAQQYRLLTEAYPDDSEGFRGLAEVSMHTGRPQDSVPAEQRAIELEPHSAVGHLRLILYLDRLNRFDDALSAYDGARKMKIASPLLHWGAGLAYLGKGETDKARSEFQALGTEGGLSGESIASFYLARVLMYEGRLREAAAELQKGLVLDEKMHAESYMPIRHYLLATIALAQGKTSEARAESKFVARAALNAPQSQRLRRAGEIALRSGEVATAREILRSLAALRESHQSELIDSCYYGMKGSLELFDRHADASVESQKKATVFFPLYTSYIGLGDALAAKRKWSEAARAYEKYLGFEGEIFHNDSPSDWVLAQLAAARALARAGDSAESLKYYDEFLQIWAHADADLAAVREARAERNRLSRPHPAPGKKQPS